jgi:hypothetical protein
LHNRSAISNPKSTINHGAIVICNLPFAIFPAVVGAAWVADLQSDGYQSWGFRGCGKAFGIIRGMAKPPGDQPSGRQHGWERRWGDYVVRRGVCALRRTAVGGKIVTKIARLRRRLLGIAVSTMIAVS